MTAIAPRTDASGQPSLPMLSKLWKIMLLNFDINEEEWQRRLYTYVHAQPGTELERAHQLHNLTVCFQRVPITQTAFILGLEILGVQDATLVLETCRDPGAPVLRHLATLGEYRSTIDSGPLYPKILQEVAAEQLRRSPDLPNSKEPS